MLSHIKNEYARLFQAFYKKTPKSVEIFLVQQPMVAYARNKIKVYIDRGNNLKEQYKGYASLEGKYSSDKKYLIVTNQYDRDIFMLATENTLFKYHRIELAEECSTCLKYNIEEIEAKRHEFFMKGFYNEFFYPLITDRMLHKYISSNAIKDIVRTCSIYEGSNGQIGEQDVMNFLKQFMTYNDQKNNVRELLIGIKNLLLKATYINRKVIVKSIVSMMKKIALPRYFFYNAGNKLDSSAHITYFLNDVKKEKKCPLLIV